MSDSKYPKPWGHGPEHQMPSVHWVWAYSPIDQETGTPEEDTRMFEASPDVAAEVVRAVNEYDKAFERGRQTGRLEGLEEAAQAVFEWDTAPANLTDMYRAIRALASTPSATMPVPSVSAEEVKANITCSFKLVDELKAENAALRAALERQAVSMCLRFGRGRGSPDACNCCQEVHAAARKALGAP